MPDQLAASSFGESAAHVAVPRDGRLGERVTPSAVEGGGQVEPEEALRVGDHVDFHDLAARW